MSSFSEFLTRRNEAGGFSTEDVLSTCLPLLREVAETHAQGKVAPLNGIEALQVDGSRIWYPETARLDSRRSKGVLRSIHNDKKVSVEIIAEHRVDHDLNSGEVETSHLDIDANKVEGDGPKPSFVPGYRSYEHKLDHHDPLTDTFVLGLILASVALSLDFTNPEDLNSFVEHRDNLFVLDSNLHPVIAKGIYEMTQLDRARRPQDLDALIRSLADYRDQSIDLDLDLLREKGFQQKDLQGRHQIVLSKLQQRLFEISRRNRLLHFKATQQSTNLTCASVPLSFDPSSLRADQILTWNHRFKKDLISGDKVSLNKYLNYEEASYLPSALDKIRSEARKDKAEFGFSQLRLTLCFLRWTNLKEGKEHFESPLLLLPVSIGKKKGVKDQHYLKAHNSEAEVNPVLRYYMRELYNLELPESIDLETAEVEDLHRLLSTQIRASEPAVNLTLLDKPRISLLHQRARQRLDRYQKRTTLGRRGKRTYPDLDYCYAKSDFRPLGLQLFRQKVQINSTNLSRLFSPETRRPEYVAEAASDDGPMRAVSQSFYSLEHDSKANPYEWEMDLCCVTLGNFKYRKMSLVRDYEALLEEMPDNPAFDAVFSLMAAQDQPLPVQEGRLEDSYPVVPCDPTQSQAIAYASAGKSFIIQGPPGTGKSQTITNLIADYVARGKQVLFVCEKRSALDVVYRRLEERGLSKLCSLVHDAQADKKELILDLKEAYETTLTEYPPVDRNAQLKGLGENLLPLRDSHDAMLEERAELGCSVREALARSIHLESPSEELSAVERQSLPAYAHWSVKRASLTRLYEALLDAEPSGVYRRHPLRMLKASLGKQVQVGATIAKCMEEVLPLLGRAVRVVETISLPASTTRNLAALLDASSLADRHRALAERSKLGLWDSSSETTRDFKECDDAREVLGETLSKAEAKAEAWHTPLSEDELESAIAQAKALESNLLAFLNPAWWRLRKALKQRYDFDKAAIKPTWTQALKQLHDQYAAEGATTNHEAKLRDEFGIQGEMEQHREGIDDIHSAPSHSSHGVLRDAVIDGSVSHDDFLALADLSPILVELMVQADSCLQGYDADPLGELATELETMLQNLDAVPGFLHCLVELDSLSPELQAEILKHDWTSDQLEAALAHQTVDVVLRGDRRLSHYDGRQRDRIAGHLATNYDTWLEHNAGWVCGEVQSAFLEDHRLLALNAAQMTPEEKARKKVFNKGLRELQHEFKKTRAYKSIRDLSAEESGQVIQKLKPVWLMSPLSVSDTLPMEVGRFDVVIFDEASQITLEEAVPCIFRAQQIIVVGDEMQLPPTNFFSAKQASEDNDDEEQTEHVLGSASFLSHSTRNLQSSMLGWHYRSRSESLISFSNQLFYGGALLTVPDERVCTGAREELIVTDTGQGANNVAPLLDRALSYHLMRGGIYDMRRNRMEADYIAEIVRELLHLENGKSIGIVAFSQAQQTEIEEALQRLGRADRRFADQLEAEFEREEKGQFMGLLVKNLENIQGDERDIIIMSVCYGTNPKGKMLMNFGPINLSGGEKRLNVAFSRAKHHMVLVSSIRSTAITNDYNVGANCLKSYLRYAELTSRGDETSAQAVLEQLRPSSRTQHASERTPHPVAMQLANKLREAGYLCELDLGHSDFRCDLAVRVPGAPHYALGVLLDGESYYSESDPIERDLMKPRLLDAFGWKINHVLAMDWWKNPEAEFARICELLPPSGNETPAYSGPALE
ncbi:MAG: DUF4011 domain-containing protein [bacterium]|nr:DUF4011 domain-containing protein [bacterium]